MSLITENTIVVKSKDEPELLKDYERYKGTYHRINGFNKIYANNEMCIYVFDANGDSPWEIERDTVKPIAIETRYPDGTWTRVNGKDYGWTLKRWLKGKVPEEIIEKIGYTF